MQLPAQEDLTLARGMYFCRVAAKIVPSNGSVMPLLPAPLSVLIP